jgi:dTDP-4-amino-4,6-dideoxygalactose transaminase
MAGPGLAWFGAEEQDLVLEVLQSRELSRYRFDDDGSSEPSKVYQFEREFETLLSTPFCLGTNSCTSALFSGLLAAGIGPGDEVIVPGYTFIAPMAAIAYCGAVPVLAEIDASLTLDPDDVTARLTDRSKALIAVHMLGAPCDLDRLSAIADRHGLMLIEDCAQAGGGSFRGRSLGTAGQFGAFSLNVFKTFTAGDGGVLATSDEELYKRAFAIHDHGSAPFRHGVTDGPALFGLNLRMHEITGALALAQVRKLPAILSRLRQLKASFRNAIGDLPGVTERALNDPDGECATVLAYVFDSSEHARRAAVALGTITLDQSGKHNYAKMPQLQQLSADGRGRRYRAGALPRTDDLLTRTIALSVGVLDSYLGTSFGINIDSTPEDIKRKAESFRTAATAVYV